MNDFTFDLISDPVFWGSFATSVAAIAAIRVHEHAAEKREQEWQFYPELGRYEQRIATRVRLGVLPVLTFGEPNRGRLFRPGFLLTEVLPREPLALLPLCAAWFCWLSGEPIWSAKFAAFGLAWRIVYDGFWALSGMPFAQRLRTLALKCCWMFATSVYLVSLGVLVLTAVLLVLLILTGFAATRRPRRDRN